ncbi:hypothetical protein M0802_002691 [Mischocyttarus mexicanus]|nr:hypothetical protein M0802_002691 [Mischocyttarus mexicanus]
MHKCWSFWVVTAFQSFRAITNSIRHNLSLHCKFMRVQNEGTGKSSWWMINHDAKPGKSPRRRATSMETSKFEKRRGRVKKKVEALRNGVLQADAIPSPSSSVSESLDLFSDSSLHPSGYQLSPDLRPRTSSNASSSGRLSPIPAGSQIGRVLEEPDWTPTYAPSYSPEQLDSLLAGSLAETMKLEPFQMYQTPTPNHQQQAGPPPSYFETQYQRTTSALRTAASFGLPPTPQPRNQQSCPIHRLQACACQVVINHELSMDETLDFNFQQGVMGTAAIQVSDTNIGQNGLVTQNNGVVTTTGNAPTGVYMSTNAATPAAPPSWVH